jgi:exopolysaccharide biosynthesis operon protein EpsL
MNAVDRVRLSLGALFLFAITPAAAGSDDLLSVNVVASRTYFDNLFKRPSDAGVSRDQLTTTQVTVAARKSVSLQGFDLSATLVDNSYRKFDSLNSQNNNYNAAWRWQITPHVTGTISSSRQQSQTDFADFRGAGQNLRTAESRRANAEWNIMGGWTVGTGLTRSKQINSQTFVEDAGNEQRVADMLVRYAFPSGTTITLNHSKSNGDFSRAPDPLTLSDSGFSDTREDFNLAWPITGKTNLTAGLGRISRQYENFGVRDFVGRNGNLSLAWTATAKSSVTLTRTRSTDSWEDPSSSFAIRNLTDLSGNLLLSSKLSMRASIGRETRTLGGFALIPSAFSRIDKTGRESLSLSWAPMSSISVTATIQQSRRSSTTPGTNYSDRSATMSATASF